MIKNVIFDIGMVLVDFRWRAFLKDRNVSDEDIDLIGRNAVLHPLWTQMDQGLRPEKDIIADMMKKLPGKEAEFALLFEDMTELVRPIPGNREWLGALKEKGLHIYLLSNYPHDMFAHHAANSFDFMDLIDGKIVSSYVKMIKPNENIYKCLLDTYGLVAEECVFLDDRKENTDAARRLGFRTVTVESRQQAVEALNKVISNS